MKVNMSQYLERIDIFGFAVTFRIMQQRSHRTKVGGYFTLLLVGTIIYQVISLLSFVISQSSPNVVTQTNYADNQELYVINPTSFSFAFGVQDPLGNSFIDETVYYLTVFQQINTRVYNQTTGSYQLVTKLKYYDISPCSMEYFQIKDVQSYFSTLPLSQMYCINLNEDSINIEGVFTDNLFEQLNVQVFECTNAIGCAPPSYRQSKLTNARFAIFASDNNVQLTNRDQPYQIVGKNLFWNISPNLESEVRYNIINNYIYTDVGLLTSDVIKTRVVNYNSDTVSYLGRLTPRLFKFYLLYEKNKERVFYRSYMKLVQAFSQVGGTFNILVAIGCFLCFPISQKQLNMKIMNTIFDVRSNSENKNKNDSHKKIKKTQTPKTPKDYNKNLCQSMQLNDKKISQPSFTVSEQTIEANSNSPFCQKYIEKLKNANQEHKAETENINENNRTQEVEKRGKNLSSPINYLKSFFKCFLDEEQKQKEKLVKLGTDIIHSNLDIFNIINKFLEIEKLKHLLLNENQLMLFDYMPKPQLKLDESQQQEQKQELQQQQSVSKDEKKEKISQRNKEMTFSTSFIKKSTPKMQAISPNLKQRVNFNVEQDFIITAKKTEEEKLKDAMKAYSLISKETKKTQIDQKLIQMLDNKFIQKYSEWSHNDGRPNERGKATSIFHAFKKDKDEIQEEEDNTKYQFINTKYQNQDIQLSTLNDSSVKYVDTNFGQVVSPQLMYNKQLSNSLLFFSKQNQTGENDTDEPLSIQNNIKLYSSDKKQCELSQI